MKLFLAGAMSLFLAVSCHQASKEYKEASTTNPEVETAQPPESPAETSAKHSVEVPETSPTSMEEEQPVLVQPPNEPTTKAESPEAAIVEATEVVPDEVEEAPVDPQKTAPNHTVWDQIVRKHVSATGKVDYRGIKTERGLLDKYLKLLQDNPIQDSWSRNEQLTYWVNAYNAFTVDLILRNYPLKSIMDLDKPWDQKFIKLGTKMYSLNQIEHEIVRPVFKDPRIHFALVCAAASCPKLLNRAYQPATINQQFDQQTRYFLNKSGKNSLTPQAVEVSQLFNWYGDDFKTSGTILDFLNKYSEQPINSSATIEFATYDWALNE